MKHRKVWDRQTLETLVKMYRAGERLKTIAAAIGTKTGNVAFRLYHLRKMGVRLPRRCATEPVDVAKLNAI